MRRALLAPASAGALLPWIELWYGTTFDYGPLRDKQGLPNCVNNLGPLGSSVFLTYLLWRVPLPAGRLRRLPDRPAPGVRAAAIGGALVAQYLLLRVVEQPWYLESS